MLPLGPVTRFQEEAALYGWRSDGPRRRTYPWVFIFLRRRKKSRESVSRPLRNNDALFKKCKFDSQRQGSGQITDCSLSVVSGSFMAYDVKQHFDHFTMRNGYGGGGYNTGGFGRRRREAPDATGKLLFHWIEIYYLIAVQQYLDSCSSPWIQCDESFCEGDAACEAEFAGIKNGSKKGTRQFRTTQALVFGIGIFLGEKSFVCFVFWLVNSFSLDCRRPSMYLRCHHDSPRLW